MSADFVIAPDDLTATDVLALLARHQEELRRCSPDDACHVMGPERLREPDVTFFVARHEGELAAFGALKPLDARTGELKSMRAAEGWRGKGAGSAILTHLIGEARARGYREVGLETGRHATFADAQALYKRAGFIACESFGTYRSGEFTLCMTLALG